MITIGYSLSRELKAPTRYRRIFACWRPPGGISISTTQDLWSKESPASAENGSSDVQEEQFSQVPGGFPGKHRCKNSPFCPIFNLLKSMCFVLDLRDSFWVPCIGDLWLFGDGSTVSKKRKHGRVTWPMGPLPSAAYPELRRICRFLVLKTQGIRVLTWA